ncbi:MAG: ATP-grasp domain-containing protein [Rhodanobacter sp.]|nr:MAG: ATP-grasp domain-containing protein [Rhodanobacter sp.]
MASTYHATGGDEVLKQADVLCERRVLVFPAGTEIGMEIFAALRGCRNIKLFGAGDDVSNHARFAYREYYVVRNVHLDGWLEDLISICARLQIGYIFPAHDDAVVALSEAREHIGAVIVTSPPDACLTTRSKSQTYRKLGKILPVPRIYNSASEVMSYPVFVKPDRGQGSRGAQRIDSNEQLEVALKVDEEMIICDYLSGDEYTVDCLSSAQQGLLFAGARQRRRTRNGISVNTITENIPGIWEMASKISNELTLRGAWFFQLKRDTAGTLTLLEVAPRVAGAMAAHRVSGVNFPLLSILEQDGILLKVTINPGTVELDRSLRNRYLHDIQFTTVYVDLDDTLICNDEVNLDVLRLLYSCINRRKPVILLTRHQGDLTSTLQKYRLTSIFDEVIHIRDGTPKSAHIMRSGAIFIDDSFTERAEVARVCGIPTFDASMLEMLIEQAEPLNTVVDWNKSI